MDGWAAFYRAEIAPARARLAAMYRTARRERGRAFAALLRAQIKAAEAALVEEIADDLFRPALRPPPRSSSRPRR